MTSKKRWAGSLFSFARGLRPRKPFKGTFYYEWQIGPWVFMVAHRDGDRVFRSRERRGLHVWRDPYWRVT